MMNFLEIIFLLLLQKNFDMAKNIRGFLENLFEYYFLNLVMMANLSIIFWLLLWMLTSLVI